MKKRIWTLAPWFLLFSAAMFVMAVFTIQYNELLACLELIVSGASAVLVLVLSINFRRYIQNMVKTTANHISGFNSDFLDKYKYPVVVVGSKGDIFWCNSRFRKVLGSRSPEGDSINAYLGGKSIFDIADSDGVDVAIDGKEFTVYALWVGDGIICHFIDNTYYKSVVREYNASLPCVALITFDNADDFLTSSEEFYSTVAISVEANLQGWAMDYDAMYKKISNNRYMLIFRDADVDKMISLRFPILKDIRSIGTARYTPTISVGLARGCKTVHESEIAARKALEMSLGRGGDQVAIIKDNSYEFFGGTAAASEKVSKVRMRVIANAIRRSVADSDKVYIMGHRFSDLDCIGAGVGLQCIMEQSFKKYSKVVVNEETSMARQLIDYTREKLDTEVFITPENAIKGVTSKSLLIIVDTHIKRSEMCAEIISYFDDQSLGYIQADALLSGIMLDTKNFVLKTGVRTFEAAAYLRRKGANTLTVKEMFSGSIETYREKVDIVVRSEVYRGCAVSKTNLQKEDIRLAAAQAADEMLTLKGIVASFVIFGNEKKLNISARSYGRVNVQLIMEKLGGGGHQTMAATQLYDTTFESTFEQLKQAIDKVLDDNEE